MKVIALALAIMLAGCNGLTFNQGTTLATSKAIVAASEQLDTLNKLGHISDEDELDYQKKLLQAHDMLSGASATFGELPECAESQSRFECADQILAYIETIILKETP